MTKTEALKLALEAFSQYARSDQTYAAITAIKEALAQPTIKRYLTVELNREYTERLIAALEDNSDPVSIDAAEEFRRLLTSPKRQPLTVQEVEQIIARHDYELHGDRARYIVRMTEQAHGIKEKST
jgi:hypothetical protein